MSGKQSQCIRRTTLPDIRDRFCTCLERDRIPFLLGLGGGDTHKIEGSVNFHDCMFDLDSLAFKLCHFSP